MLREVAFAGLLVPALLVHFLACLLLFYALDLGLARLGAYRFVWHPPLARIALFTALFTFSFVYWPGR